MSSANGKSTPLDFTHAPTPGGRLLAFCLDGTQKEELKVPVANDNEKIDCPRCLGKLHKVPQYANLLFTSRRIDGRGL